MHLYSELKVMAPGLCMQPSAQTLLSEHNLKGYTGVVRKCRR